MSRGPGYTGRIGIRNSITGETGWLYLTVSSCLGFRTQQLVAPLTRRLSLGSRISAFRARLTRTLSAEPQRAGAGQKRGRARPMRGQYDSIAPVSMYSECGTCFRYS
ncbi:hypothetical protein GALMADRAFT_798084 [Galerina marginata CBS 339.88]|uniref:Uncharacterized protein n=1 Tax=Galerina marginata (strain CBS 339.88) TaxID=685588 RepID=A0A067SMN2_GALM3|nr:hypothetical protein GALMADRAFT_798084 [Galerina marginata CBS 339.88]